jgi:hypothetical protein
MKKRIREEGKDEELNEIQEKIKELEQIAGRKRKAGEMNDGNQRS